MDATSGSGIGRRQSAQGATGLYRLGGWSALAVGVILLGEVAVYATWRRPESVLGHLQVLQDNWLVGLLTLDLLGMIAYLALIPTMLAVRAVLSEGREAALAVTTVVYLIGVADFFATNTAFPMLDLSARYAAATNAAERDRLLAAAEAMVTMFNENAFLVSYVLVSGSWLAASAVMLRSGRFSRTTGWAGVVAGAAGVVAVILEHVTTHQVVLSAAIGCYFLALVALLLWVTLVGRALLRDPDRASRSSDPGPGHPKHISPEPLRHLG